MIWSNIGQCVNEFRQNDLGLDPMQLSFAPGLLQRLDCPVTYFRYNTRLAHFKGTLD